LPTICLPTKLQVGNSSCMTRDFWTSSHT
jgi:hypothetical protein